jgi:hypothetical protein
MNNNPTPPPAPNGEYPFTDPANAGIRDEFCLNTFPPAGGGHNHTPAPVPAP